MERTADDRRESLHPDPPPAGSLARTLGVWLLVVATAALTLRIADALPRAMLGVPRGIRRAPDVAELERLSNRRMPVPSFFPDNIEWPPAEARVHTAGSAAIWCRQRSGGGLALIVATAPPGTRGIATEVLPGAVELQHEDTSLDGRPAVVSRVRDEAGAVWQQVQWKTPAQIILVRYRGTLDQLLRIAGSVHE
jgi:hypothetical protein